VKTHPVELKLPEQSGLLQLIVASIGPPPRDKFAVALSKTTDVHPLTK
jgi:hypothetical protein